MPKAKVHRFGHLDAMQGASEEHPEAYSTYAEDVPQPGNAAVRQKQLHDNCLWQLAGRCDG